MEGSSGSISRANMISQWSSAITVKQSPNASGRPTLPDQTRPDDQTTRKSAVGAPVDHSLPIFA
jgi:hypothetical protein